MPDPRTTPRRSLGVELDEVLGRSPTPANRTGTPSPSSIAKTIPPQAVESSLVGTMPVGPPTRGTRPPGQGRSDRSSRRGRAASLGSHPAVGQPTMTRRIFASSSMRFDFVCSRPAVSISTMSARRATAASRASNTTAAGSAPGACATMSTPALSRPRSGAGRWPRRGTVGGGEDDASAGSRLPRRELADGRRLAGAVDTDRSGPRQEGLLDREPPARESWHEQRGQLTSDRGCGAIGRAPLAGSVDDLGGESSAPTSP